MKFLIIGRSGTGKDTLTNALVRRGLKRVTSYATRPKRTPDEDTHVFITAEEALAITDRVAETKIGQYEYFVSREQVENSDVYVIDPRGFYELTKNMPDEHFVVVYIKSDVEEAMSHALMRSSNPDKERDIFVKRRADEDEQFLAFEEKLEAKDTLAPNCSFTSILVNTYREDLVDQWADSLMAFYRKWKNMEHIVDVCVVHHVLHVHGDKIMVCEMRDGEATWRECSHDNFIASVLGSNEGLASLMHAFLSIETLTTE